MKKIIIFIAISVAVIVMGCGPTKVDTRNYAYEAYCDSIWKVDPDYYLDVLVEGDEYCTYIEEYGQWWEN